MNAELNLFLLAYSIATTLILARIAWQNYKHRRVLKMTSEALDLVTDKIIEIVKDRGMKP